MKQVRRLLAGVVLAGALVALSGGMTRVYAFQDPPLASAGQQTEAGKTGSGQESGTQNTWKPVIAKAVNFALLVGILVYFLRTPLSGYLTGRIVKVREDLVTAAQMREAASRQLAAIEAKLRELPAEIAALRARGAEDIAAERVRIEEAGEIERQRVLEQTRREIDGRLRLAHRELVEHAATLAIAMATERVASTITPADQARLVDRYTAQIGAERA